MSISAPALREASIPILVQSTGVPLVDIAAKVMLGVSLREQGYARTVLPEKKFWYVKAPAFSFAKLGGTDAYLSPEMKSTEKRSDTIRA